MHIFKQGFFDAHGERSEEMGKHLHEAELKTGSGFVTTYEKNTAPRLLYKLKPQKNHLFVIY